MTMGIIERIIPDNLNSRLQKYRLPGNGCRGFGQGYGGQVGKERQS